MFTRAERIIVERLIAGEYLIQVCTEYVYSAGGDAPASEVNALWTLGHLVAVRNTLVLSDLARLELAGVDLEATAKALEKQNANRD